MSESQPQEHLDAKVGVFQREPLPEWIEEATRQVAEPKQLAVLDPKMAFVFRLGNEWLAFRAAVCREIATWRGAHSIPSRRDGFILGLVNVRGELLICVSLEKVLGIDADTVSSDAASQLKRLVVIENAGERFAFPAAEVHGLVRHTESDLQKAPTTVEHATLHFTHALLPWDGHSVAYLDEELLFYTLTRGLA